MADVEEIIDYLRSLKKGFDKDLFQNKIDELGYAVDTVGLSYDDFQSLFKVWLNLSIPITKWVGLGACLVPLDAVEERTVEYAFRWILANFENQSQFSRTNFLLDWLTAAMECNCINMDTLDSGYELFYTLLAYEVLTPHVMKLVYTLTKPIDVTRRRVLELLDYAKKREAKKNMYRQLQILLGLFKSYKPECVPEDVPAISIYTAFKKINVNLLTRFQRSQSRRHAQSKESSHLLWFNPMNTELKRNKKAEPLVPSMQFLNVGYKQNADKEPEKNYLDFTDAASLVSFGVRTRRPRPARLRAQLAAAPGLLLLAAADPSDQAFFSHDLQHLLTDCFLEISPHSYTEKQYLLRRLSVLQHTLLQGIPVITRFLAQYLPFWNEIDYFAEILDLIEWVNVSSPAHVTYIVDTLTRVYHRAQPLEQCAILRSLTNMYNNAVYSTKTSQQHFMNTNASPADYALVLPQIAASIDTMCTKGLQVNPEDMRVVYSSVRSVEARATYRVVGCSGERGVQRGVQRGGERSGECAVAMDAPPALLLAAPLYSISATLLDKMASIMIQYKKVFVALKSRQSEEGFMEQIQILKGYTTDMSNCLYSEQALSDRHSGLVFNRLHPQIVDKISKYIPDVDSKLSIRNHLAFAPYTYMQLGAIDCRDADNKLWFEAVIDQEFSSLGRYLKIVVPELRH